MISLLFITCVSDLSIQTRGTLVQKEDHIQTGSTHVRACSFFTHVSRHSDRGTVTCECSESARERRIALYKSDQQQEMMEADVEPFPDDGETLNQLDYQAHAVITCSFQACPEADPRPLSRHTYLFYACLLGTLTQG